MTLASRRTRAVPSGTSGYPLNYGIITIGDAGRLAKWSAEGMTARAGVRLRERARRQELDFLRRNRWPVIGFAGFGLVVSLLPTLLLPRGFRAFYAGVAVASVLWLIQIWVRDYSGAHRAAHGADGEENTATVLRSLERNGWRVIHDIEFSGFNVDHVAVGPSGIYAIETKNTSAHWNLTSARNGQYLADAIDQARFGARKIRLLLNEGAQLPVTPVVICWGPGIGDLADKPLLRGEVLVAAGREAARLLGRVQGNALDAFTIDCLAERIEAYVRSRDVYLRRHTTKPSGSRP